MQEVKFTVSPKMFVASIARKGSRLGVADAIEELEEWIDPKGIREELAEPVLLIWRTRAGRIRV